MGVAHLPRAAPLVRAADPAEGSAQQPARRRDDAAAHRGRLSASTRAASARCSSRIVCPAITPRRRSPSRRASSSPRASSASSRSRSRSSHRDRSRLRLREDGGGEAALPPPPEPEPVPGVPRQEPPEPKRPADSSLVIAFAVLWIVCRYFPVSNIPILLPTVRAERFWYFPAIGTSFILALVFGALRRSRAKGSLGGDPAVVAGRFFVWQSVAARAHANDYTNDLVFWDATRKAVPRSAKAHLNYSVMKGARGDLEERRRANVVALELAPQWPMANVYLGDTLCRMHRAQEAWPHYNRGFELAPNDPNLISLGLQCLWDEKMLVETRTSGASSTP